MKHTVQYTMKHTVQYTMKHTVQYHPDTVQYHPDTPVLIIPSLSSSTEPTVPIPPKGPPVHYIAYCTSLTMDQRQPTVLH